MSSTDGQHSPHVADLIARELRAALARRRMTHADLARAGRIPESTVNRILRGETHMSLDQYVTMTAALGECNGEDRQAIVRGLVAEVRRRAITGGQAAS